MKVTKFTVRTVAYSGEETAKEVEIKGCVSPINWAISDVMLNPKIEQIMIDVHDVTVDVQVYPVGAENPETRENVFSIVMVRMFSPKSPWEVSLV